jgi:hypothetical protein
MPLYSSLAVLRTEFTFYVVLGAGVGLILLLAYSWIG